MSDFLENFLGRKKRVLSKLNLLHSTNKGLSEVLSTHTHAHARIYIYIRWIFFHKKIK